jgi:ectoine hydroxylase-related dioxygenase (phytanoyl-CoA dioxygenase family)
MDSAEIRRLFDATGVVRLNAAFSAEEAAAMRDAVWSYVDRKSGLRAEERSAWPEGWSGVNWKGLRRSHVFEPLTNNTAVSAALDAVLGVGGWVPPKPGAQILFTFPQPGPWVLPDGWHMDCGFEQPTWPVFAVKLFAFFGEVGPEGGGTMLLPGTHRLVERYRTRIPEGTGGGKQHWRAFMQHDPWLAQLLDGAERPDLGRSLVGQSREVDGVPVEIVELTGRPGDIVLAHLHVFHTASPNTAEHPRQMLGKAIAATAAA